VNTKGRRECAASGSTAQANTGDSRRFGRKRRENVISADNSPPTNSFITESKKREAKSTARNGAIANVALKRGLCFPTGGAQMANVTLRLAASAAALATVAACGSVSPDYAYSTTVRLHDGKTVDCDVNETPPSTTQESNGLTLTEQRQAEVLATQRLRLLSGPYAPYPTPYTAPIVRCRRAM
jgi:hypothetical protein